MREIPPTTLAAALGVEAGGLVALVGGGGKTTAMYRLLREWLDRGLRAAAATTTKIAVPGPGEPELCLGETWEDLASALDLAPGRPAVLGCRRLGPGKVEGVPPQWCDRFLIERVLDALAVEADGAARLPVKAPAQWEPVVPATTSAFVAVVGLSCLGAPLDEGHAFRPERIARVAGLAAGERIDPSGLVRLLRSVEGLAKGRPPGARAVVLLNQADGPEELAAARRVAEGVLAPGGGWERVVAAALRSGPSVRAVWMG